MKRMSCLDSTANTSGSVPTSSREGGTGGATAINPAVLIAASASASDTGRSLIVDERFFEEQFLRCQICHEKFNQSERSPKSLPCNHTFCLPCLTQIFDHAQPPTRRTLVWASATLDGTLKCPTCRVEIFLGRNKIKELPNDHRVVQMMDFFSQAVTKSQNVCSKHDGQPLSFFCKKCLTPVCRDCTVLDHKESDGHKIVDLSEALNENSDEFNDIETKSRETLEGMKTRSDCLANASKRLDILERHLNNEIKETFIEYRLLIEKRQEALTSMVHQIVKEQKAKVNAKFAYVCEHGTQLQKLYDEFKASRNSNDIRKLFAINQQMKEHENQFTQIAAQNDADLFQSCEFEAQNEGSFLSDMSGLGEVRAKPDPDLGTQISAHQLMYLDMEERRERERIFDNESSNNYVDDDHISLSDVMNVYHSDDAEPTADEDDPQTYWPNHYAVMSHLMSNYARFANDAPEAMDDTDVAALGSRQSKRGRRPRDTNSFQVQSSIAPENPEFLNFIRPRPSAASSATPSAASGAGRSGSRSRAPGSSGTNNFRVVRHTTASSLRNQPNFGNDDSTD